MRSNGISSPRERSGSHGGRDKAVRYSASPQRQPPLTSMSHPSRHRRGASQVRRFDILCTGARLQHTWLST